MPFKALILLLTFSCGIAVHAQDDSSGDTPKGESPKGDSPKKDEGKKDEGKKDEKKGPSGEVKKLTGNDAGTRPIGPTTGPVVREYEFPPIVAVVGEESISRQMFQTEYQRRLVEYQSASQLRMVEVPTQRIVKETLEDLVHSRLLVQSAVRKAGGREPIELVPEEKVMEEIDRRVEDLKNRGYREFTSREDYFASQLKQFGKSRDKVIEDVRDRILINSYLWEEIFKSLDRFIPPSESRSYYRNHLGEFTQPLGYSFRRIQFQDAFNTNEKVRAIQETLRQNEPFVDVAKKHSEEFQSVNLRGRLWEKSFEEVQQMPFPFPQILSKMKEKEVSGPYRAQGQIFFVLLETVKKGEPATYEKAQPAIEAKLLGLRHEASTATLLRKLKRGTRIESYIEGISLSEDDEVAEPQGVESGSEGATGG